MGDEEEGFAMSLPNSLWKKNPTGFVIWEYFTIIRII